MFYVYVYGRSFGYKPHIKSVINWIWGSKLGFWSCDRCRSHVNPAKQVAVVYAILLEATTRNHLSFLLS
jgi:hypothetical protein